MSRPRLARRAVAAAVLPLALTSLSACGNDSSSSAKDASSSSSASASTPAPPAPGSTVATADFVDQYKAAFDSITTAHMAMKSQVMGGTITGDGDVDYSQDSPAAAMKMSGSVLGNQSMEVRLVDKVMYMNLGAMTGNKFAKIDLNDPSNPMGQFADSMDPSRMLDAMQSAITKVTYVGKDGNGAHYQISLDTAALMKSMGQDGQAAAGAGMPASVTYDLWLDDQGRFSTMKMDLGNLGTTQVTMSDYGEDVSIQAPPASQVTDGPMKMAG